ncbi:MAG: DMT family transporter [Erysipelotrichaceae bacterium]
MTKNKKYGKTALLVASFLWGIGFVAVQGALDSGWHPYLLLGFRGLMGGAFLGLFSLNRKWWKKRTLMRDGFLAGSLMFLAFTLQTFGQQASSATNASFLTTLYVMFTPLLLFLITGKKIGVSTLIAGVLSLVATALLTLRGSMNLNFGDLLLIGCAVVFALHILVLEKTAYHDDALSLTVLQCLTMSAWSFLFSFFFKTTVPAQGWGFVAYCGIVSSGLAFFLQTYGQKYVDSAIAAILLTLEALFGALGAVLFLHEPFGPSAILGGVLMMGAIVLLESGPILHQQFTKAVLIAKREVEKEP